MEYLKPVVMDLIYALKYQDAWDLIDFYFSRATSLKDYDVLGHLALESNKLDTYFKCAIIAYSLTEIPEQQYIARINLFKAYNVMNYPEKALFYIEQNLQITPDDFDTLCQKAQSLSLLGYRYDSEKIFDTLIEKYPEKKKILQSGVYKRLIQSGNLSKGIDWLLSSDRPEKNVFEKELRMKEWDGNIHIKSILYVSREGGIGDTIVNIRFFDKLKNYGIEPILYSPPNSTQVENTDNLFRRHGYKVINDTYSINPLMPWARLMKLPVYLDLKERDLWSGPYLKPLRKNKNKINSTKFKIGIKCSGNKYFIQNEYRKIPLDSMLKHLPKDTEIYYLDKEVGHPDVINLGDKIESWDDTLDFIDQMDCIVTSCTSLAHASGALGKTTFVVVPITEFYTWTTSEQGSSTPWYGDNFFVMRQVKIRDWEHPLELVHEHLIKIMPFIKEP